MSYTSNIQKVLDEIAFKLGHLPIDDITVSIGQALVASNIERIHQDGKAVDNTLIGQYSTKDILVGKKSFIKESAWNTLYKNNIQLNKRLKRAQKAKTKAAFKDFATFEKASIREENIKKNYSGWRTIKKNGKLYKLILLPGGYKQLRAIQGRKTDKVNLNYSGKLQSELNLVVVNNKADIGFTTSYGGTISEALEDKYGKKIWGVSKADKKEIINIIKEEILKKLNE